jgi:hypothetical protein
MTRLSNRQYPMLRMFTDLGLTGVMTIEQAQQWDQRPFRSMLMRGWVAYKPGRNGFSITKSGVHALNEFLSTDIARRHPEMPLTAYFDPDAYKLHRATKKAAA